MYKAYKLRSVRDIKKIYIKFKKERAWSSEGRITKIFCSWKTLIRGHYKYAY